MIMMMIMMMMVVMMRIMMMRMMMKCLAGPAEWKSLLLLPADISIF